MADPMPGRAKQIAETFHIPHWFENYEDLCALKEIEAVSIVTPGIRAPQARRGSGQCRKTYPRRKASGVFGGRR